jgi:hypothetical protein
MLLEQLQACLTHSTYFREAREEFYSVTQSVEENTTAYFSRINELYSQSKFPNGTTFLVVDKLIHGCVHDKAKRELMAKGADITIKQCLEIMRRHEAVDVTMKKLSATISSENQVNASYSHDPTKRSQKQGSKSKATKPTRKVNDHDTTKRTGSTCVWCSGDSHPRTQCPARNAQCGFCKKDGHFEKACLLKKKERYGQSKRQHAVDVASEGSDYEIPFDLDTVSIQAVKSQKHNEVFAPVTFHSHSHSIAKGKVDTGAMVSCIPLSLLQKIGISQQELRPSSAVIKGISGANLQNHGTLDIKVTCNDICERAIFYITENECPFILGKGKVR